jgi:nitrate reductase NapAB chaperone NapD
MNATREEDAVGCIVGAVLQVKPGMEDDVRQCVLQYEGIEIHAEDEQSRWVITLEAKTSKKILNLTEEIQNIHGILSVTPVYQHCEENQQHDQQGGWRWR